MKLKYKGQEYKYRLLSDFSPKKEHPKIRSIIFDDGWKPKLFQLPHSTVIVWDGMTMTDRGGRMFLTSKAMSSQMIRMVKEGFVCTGIFMMEYPIYICQELWWKLHDDDENLRRRSARQETTGMSSE